MENILPLEILKLIADNLDEEDIRPFAATCKKFFYIVHKFVYGDICVSPVEVTSAYIRIHGISSANITDCVLEKSEIKYRKHPANVPKKGGDISLPQCADEHVKRYISEYGHVCRCAYIDLSHYREIKSIFIFKCKVLSKDADMIFIKLPRYCERLLVVHADNVILIPHERGTIFKKLECGNNAYIEGNIKVREVLCLGGIFEKRLNISTKRLFEICKYAKVISIIRPLNKEDNDGEIIQNNDVEEFSAEFLTENDMNYKLICPNLFSIDISVKECGDSDIFAKKMREVFINSLALSLVNPESNSDINEKVRDYIVEYLTARGYIEVPRFDKIDDDFMIIGGVNHLWVYYKDIIRMLPPKDICIIFHRIYVHKSREYIIEQILFMLKLIRLSPFQKGQEYAVIKYGGESYIVYKKDLAAFKRKRIIEYFQYNGHHNKYSLREYFPFAE